MPEVPMTHNVTVTDGRRITVTAAVTAALRLPANLRILMGVAWRMLPDAPQDLCSRGTRVAQ